MRINHNIAALNTYNKLSSATNAQSKSMEKLSSGLRINSAADDAAGLAISEKMRGQIRGLDQASRNAQDGISLIQTAEGALSETTDILQRMRELATQAANDTNTTSDRDEIQKEINQLTSEVNRIGNTTEFNTKKLLNGGKEDLAVTTVKTGSAATTAGGTPEVLGKYTLDVDVASLAENDTVEINGKTFTKAATTDVAARQFADADGLIAALNDATNGIGATYTATQGTGNTIELSQKTGNGDSTAPTANDDAGNPISITTVQAGAAEVAGTPVPAEAGKSSFDLDFTKLVDGQKLAIGDDEYEFKKDGTGDFKDFADLQTKIAGDSKYTAAQTGNTITLTQATGTESDAAAPQVSIKTGENFNATLQIGANESQSMKLEINDMRADALKLTGTGAGYTSSKDVSNGTDSTGIESGLDVSTAANAASAITTIQSAIDTVSAERSKLGAYQNRLDHTINNLSTSSENLTAAESRIRDVDYALAA